jgi:DNA-binding beta-propeller fold protein YncE
VVISMIGLCAVCVACVGCAGNSAVARSAGPPAARAAGPVAVASRGEPGCTTAPQSAPALPAAATAMATLPAPSYPFGVAVTADGRWGFASLGGSLAVLQLSAGRAPRPVRMITQPQPAVAGVALSHDGRLLLIADEASGAIVVSVRAAEQGSQHAVLGTLSAPGSASGAIEAAVSPDGRYAFVSMETSDQIAVFNLAKAMASGFGSGTYVGSIPTQVAPVGLAFSPDGSWLYSTSELQGRTSELGTIAVISVGRAETDPAGSVIDRVLAGCQPVRVTTSADGRVVWVTARASDALLAFSAAGLRTDPAHSLLAVVGVGEAPVGLAFARHGSLIVVADSDRFSSAGRSASLAVVDVAAALGRRPALIGYLPAGGFPRDVASDPGGGIVLVANYMSRQLETVNIGALP